MTKRKFQITEKHATDAEGNTLAVGTIITVKGDLDPRYVNKGIFVTGEGASADKELVVATPTEDSDTEETAVQKQSRINKRGRQRAKVM